MPATTARGVPYPVGTDPNDVPADLQRLAAWVDARPGVSALTSAQRDALTGADRWTGRVILNLSTAPPRLERWDGAAWVLAAPGDPIPTNIVTTDTTQTVSGAKTFTAETTAAALRAPSGAPLRFRDDTGATRSFVNGQGLTVGLTGPPGPTSGGVGVLALNDATTAPTANPTTGVTVYASGGVLFVRFADGTVRNLRDVVTTDTAQTVSGAKTFAATVTAGSGVLSVPDAATIPTTNPASGVTLYAEAGTLRVRGSDGTVRNLRDVVTTDTAQTVSGAKTFSSAVTAGKVQAITGGSLTAADATGTNRLVVNDRGVTVGNSAPTLTSNGTGVLVLRDAAATPTAAITDGAIVYSAGGTLRLRDNTSGVTNVPYAYRFRRRQTAVQSIPNAVDTGVSFDTTLDVYAAGASAAGPATGMVTVNRAGWWLVYLNVRFANTAAGGERVAQVWLRGSDTGSTIVRRLGMQSGPSGGVPTSLSVVGSAYVAAGQKVQPVVFQNSGAPLDTDPALAEVEFAGVWLGPTEGTAA